MRSLLHVLREDKRVGFHMMAEVRVRKQLALGRSKVGESEKREASVAEFPTREVPDVLRKNCHGLVPLLIRQV